MIKTPEDDLEMLKSPEAWPNKLFNTRFVRVKTYPPKKPGDPEQRFGSIFETDPLTVCIDQIGGRPLDEIQHEKYASAEELVKTWIVD